MEQLGGEDLLKFTTDKFSTRAQLIYDSLQIVELSGDNIWHVFSVMLAQLYPN
jgi:hypothetical protein